MTCPPPPSALFGPLFEAVQRARLFADSKTFADAAPRRSPAAILADWQAAPAAGPVALRAFVAANFEIPTERRDLPASGEDLADHIAHLWPCLTRPPLPAREGESALAVARRHVVPGGRFRELYYWDSYFTMLGLVRSGRQDLVEEMIAVFGDLLDTYGHIPNGTRSYYLSRSHPPVFYLMAALSRDGSEAARRRRLEWMRIEHRFWMAGEEELAPGAAHRRVVRLPDGSMLNRYWDDRPAPRDESWREDVALAEANPQRDAPGLWRDLRAGAESGWDFSARWLDDSTDLASIRTTTFLPIDLNSLLHGLEQAIAVTADGLGEAPLAREFTVRARARAVAIETYFWNAGQGFYADRDLKNGRANDRLTGACAFPLFCGIARPDRAARTADALAGLLRPGGLLATAIHSGQQWDAPNGWAPLQWIAVEGLRAYGHDDLARRIARRWVAMVEAAYRETGMLFEKYDVEACRGGGGGEYAPVTGFGWTNGVTLALLDGNDARAEGEKRRWG
ncbi:MAG: alpha,alpha-trehalase TreA [Sphingomonas bacterium]